MSDYTQSPTFQLAFKLAARLRDASFRKRLDEAARGRRYYALVPATRTDSVDSLISRMHDKQGLIILEDEKEPEGVRLIWWENR